MSFCHISQYQLIGVVMGKLVISVDDSEDQDCLRQNVRMLVGRVRANPEILQQNQSDKIKAIALDSSSHTDRELEQIWEVIKAVNPHMVETLIPDDSPLRQLPSDFSREQALVFDGIRYAAEMSDVAYWRLFKFLEELSCLSSSELTNRHIATAMLDAWSIVDSVHRLRDLINEAPGVTHDTWWKLFMNRTNDIAQLRDEVQHQIDNKRINALVTNAGQIWGFLSWAEVRNGEYTGIWKMMSPGAVYSGDKWIYNGPAVPPAPLPFGRIRLNAYGKEVYLGRSVKAVHDVVAALAEVLQKGTVKARGNPAVGRNGGDVIHESYIEALLSDGTIKTPLPDVGL